MPEDLISRVEDQGERPTEGWYRDPDDPEKLRYWTGSEWTERRKVAPRTDADGRPVPMSSAGRKEALNEVINEWAAKGWRVESQTDYTATIVKGEKINHLLHLVLTIITVGLWGIIWLTLAVFGGQKRMNIVIDEYGN